MTAIFRIYISPDGHRHISIIHVSCISQWKGDISILGKTNVYWKQISLDYLELFNIRKNNDTFGYWTNDCKILNTSFLPLCHIWYTYSNVFVSFWEFSVINIYQIAISHILMNKMLRINEIFDKRSSRLLFII